MGYSFADTVKGSISQNTLPSEAMSYDGIYLENEIDGYTTLNVSGRELLGADVRDDTIEFLDGSTYHGKVYPPRIITVTYQLITTSDSDFRNKFNKMNLLLSKEQVHVIFADEPDKYFIGTKIGNSEVSPGQNSVIGEIEIYCSDPHKYSLVQKEFIPAVNEEGILECIVQNDGTSDAVIDYEINVLQETGYVGIVSDKGAMQFGKVEEIDGENYKQNEMLVRITNLFDCPDEPAGPETAGTDVMHPKDIVTGKLKKQNWFNKDFLALDLNNDSSEVKGVRTFTIPADSEGKKGAKNFYTYFHILLWAGLMGQTGEMNINWLTSDDKMIAGVCFYKTDKVGNTANYELWANGKMLRKYSYTSSHQKHQNPWYWNWGHCDLKKEGSKLTFYYWGGYPSYVIPEVESMECAKIQVCFKAYSGRKGSQYLTYLGLDTFNFQKLGVDKWKDVPNRYSAGSVLKIDGETSKFSVNDMPKSEDEVVGTHYFKASPGETKVQFAFSSWVTKMPDIKIKIREAWI